MKKKRRYFNHWSLVVIMTASILGVIRSPLRAHGQAAGGSTIITTQKLTATGVPLSPASSQPAFTPVALVTTRLTATGVPPPTVPLFTPVTIVTPKLTVTGKGGQ